MVEASEELCWTVELFISVRNLKKTGSSTNPICVIQELNNKTKAWTTITKTEIKLNDYNPDFSAVKLKYFFEKTQKMKFVICNTQLGRETQEIGSYEILLGKIEGAKQQTVSDKMKDAGDAIIVLRAVTQREQEQQFALKQPEFVDYLRGGW